MGDLDFPCPSPSSYDKVDYKTRTKRPNTSGGFLSQLDRTAVQSLLLATGSIAYNSQL